MTFDVNEHSTPEKLERYAFFWSEARLLIASVALFLGGIPPVLELAKFLPVAMGGLISSLLNLSWMISGIVSVYLLFRWNSAGKKIFGGNDLMDTVAFFVNVVTGLNLGYTGFMGKNIGMSITMNPYVFGAVGVLYIITAGYLWKRWSENGGKLF
jgi:hypothetical protein